MIDNFQAKCVCQIGYSGENCEITPCSHKYCQNGGTCVINGPNAYCNCVNGFQGL